MKGTRCSDGNEARAWVSSFSSFLSLLRLYRFLNLCSVADALDVLSRQQKAALVSGRLSSRTRLSLGSFTPPFVLPLWISLFPTGRSARSALTNLSLSLSFFEASGKT